MIKGKKSEMRDNKEKRGKGRRQGKERWRRTKSRQMSHMWKRRD